MFTDDEGKVSFPCIQGAAVKVFAEDHETQWIDSLDCTKGAMTVVLNALEVRISEAVVEEAREIGVFHLQRSWMHEPSKRFLRRQAFLT